MRAWASTNSITKLALLILRRMTRKDWQFYHGAKYMRRHSLSKLNKRREADVIALFFDSKFLFKSNSY